jgi:hypothetical protein
MFILLDIGINCAPLMLNPTGLAGRTVNMARGIARSALVVALPGASVARDFAAVVARIAICATGTAAT